MAKEADRQTEAPGIQDGSQELDALFSVAYEELRRLAAAVKRSYPASTTSPASLVHAAWLKLARSPRLSAQSELHRKHIVAQAMRHLLAEAARRRGARKRGGKAAQFITFNETLGLGVASNCEFLALHEALSELGRENPREAAVVECRFFGGMEVDETAAALGVAPSTVNRDWRAAKAWLASHIRNRS